MNRAPRAATGSASILDPGRWQRLKGHVAELAELPASARALVLDALAVDADDRALLTQLLAQLDPDDLRLASPVATQATAPGGLRWQAGAMLGDYVIDGFLGRGGMSEVYAAHQRHSGTGVALKILRHDLREAGRLGFSDNECRALRRLDDPHIARFIDSFVLDDIGLCLVLEPVDGEPLADWCAQHQPGVDARLGLYLQICQAVASAHQQLVVHRDLKPDNVLVDAGGNIKLLDFGVAKLLEDESSQTQTHGGLYTLEFAAPEQVLRNPVSAATDVYALGVLLFRLLTGASPYVVGANESLVKAVLSDRPRRLAQARTPTDQGKAGPALDRDLDRVIGRAMEKDPRDRYRSVMELVADVQAIRAGMPIRAGGGRGYRLAKFVRRHPVGVVLSSLMLLALLAATGLSLHWARQADAQARSAATDARRANAANAFLLAVLDLNDSFSRRNSGDLTLAQVLDRAVQLAGTELADEPEVRAEVLSKLSVALQRRGDLSRAYGLANEALEILTPLPQRDVEAYASALRRVGSIEVDLNRLDLAQQHLSAAMRSMDGVATDHRNFTISAMTSLARIASARGDPLAALQTYQSIIELRTSLDGDNRADAAMDYSNLGAALMFLSRFDEAAAAYTQGIALLRARLGDQHPRLGVIRSGHANVLIQLGRLDEARAELLAASELMAGGGEPADRNRYQTVAELNLSVVDYWAEDYPAASARLAAIESQIPATHRSSFLLWRGRVALAQKRYTEAAADFQSAQALFVDSGGAAHPRRWLAQGLAILAAAQTHPAQLDRNALQGALDALAAPPSSLTAERAELLLQAGASARRHGDFPRAVELHTLCAQIMGKNHWLGDLGRTMIEAELRLDGPALDPTSAHAASR